MANKKKFEKAVNDIDFFDSKYKQEELNIIANAKKEETKKAEVKKETTKKELYRTLISIDDDTILEYFKLAKYIKMESTKQYVQDLIKADMKKTLKLKNDATDEEIMKAWKEFRKTFNK